MSGSRYAAMPPQTGEYAVRVKNGAGWRAYEAARLQISVGMPYHEGEKFLAVAAWTAKRFDRVIVCVNDTLQRFNFLYENPGMAEDEAARLMLRAGREWVERNIRAMEFLPGLSLYRWDEWKKIPGYAAHKQAIDGLYDSNPDFRKALDDNVREHWQRQLKNNAAGADSFHSFARWSTQYLLEETAVFGIMYAQDRAADIYPGTLLAPVDFLQENDSAGTLSLYKNSHHTRIDFARIEAKELSAA